MRGAEKKCPIFYFKSNLMALMFNLLLYLKVNKIIIFSKSRPDCRQTVFEKSGEKYMLR